MDEPIPEPLLFNYWKHHQGFLLASIRRMYNPNQKSDLKQNLKKIGNSTTDLYTGEMTIRQVYDYSMDILDHYKISDENKYIDWIRSTEELYRTLPFPDGSVWVFKIANEPGRHIHIHPGRNVPHTIRVKANVLKTAIVVCHIALLDQKDPMDVHFINQVRIEYLELAPLKYVTMNQELGRIIYNFAGKLGLLA